MVNTAIVPAPRVALPQMASELVHAMAPFVFGVATVVGLTVVLQVLQGHAPARPAPAPVLMAASAIAEVPASPDATPRPAPADAPLPSPTTMAADAPAVEIQPSFSCSGVRGQVLKLICATPALAMADQDLAEAYRVVMSRTSEPGILRATQMDWIRQRNASPADVQTLMTLYQDRIMQMRALASLPAAN